MHSNIVQIIPLVAAFIYTLSALITKKASESGLGFARLLFLTNVFRLLVALPILFFAPPIFDWSLIWAPCVAGVAAFLGTLFVLAAIRLGAVSIQTPLTGAEVLFVSIFSYFMLESEVTPALAIGAVLTCLAILTLGLPSLLKGHVTPAPIIYTLISCMLFGYSNVVTAKVASDFGHWSFLSMLSITMFLVNVVLIPFFKKPLNKTPPKALKLGYIGAFVFTVAEVMFLMGLAYFGKHESIEMNIVFSSRGLWSVFAVYFVGHWFGNKEKESGLFIMGSRLAGTLMFSIAIYLILSK